MSEFVTPTIVKLKLKKDRWIDVKRELNVDEYNKMLGAQIKDYEPGTGRPLLDPEKVGRSKVSAYLMAWSFGVPLTESAIGNLKPAVYQEMLSAINKHEAAVEAEDEKNETDGALGSAAISPSVN